MTHFKKKKKVLSVCTRFEVIVLMPNTSPGTYHFAQIPRFLRLAPLLGGPSVSECWLSRNDKHSQKHDILHN